VAGGLAAEPAGNTTVVPPQPDWKAKVDEFLTKLDRKPGETPDMMFFRYWGDNPFVEAANDPQSTFGADADTASYTLARSYLYKQGILPPREAVRSEEFINYFRSRYAPPTEEGRAFAIHCEAAPSPFGHDPEYRLLKVGLKGREVPREKRKAASLAFVVDTSGSMRRENRLELVKDALRLLVPELDEGDTIGIAAFDAEARTVLEPSPASARERILDAISRLEPRQNTNVAAGLELGFQMAAARRLKDGTNRVILLSDGVANTGVTDPEAMLERVRAQREQGIYLTCVGVGMGNHNDTLLEQLADRGNGQCVYVDRLEEARKVFVEDLTATLEAIARDVKIQVEFDPARVIRYRLLGYENRAIADALFRDNKVDAGEVGAGHEVAALYELKLQGAPAAAGKLATVRVRYLTIEHGEAVELARDVTGADVKASFAEAAPRFRISACAAEFAEVLRESYHARGSELDKVAAIVEGLLGSPDGDGRKVGDDQNVVELAALLRRADALVRERERQLTEVARTTEALKENYFLRAQVEDALQARREQNRVQLDDILRQNDALRRRLEDLLAAPR
jgi:Ca-activated chloride channel family protein